MHPVFYSEYCVSLFLAVDTDLVVIIIDFIIVAVRVTAAAFIR